MSEKEKARRRIATLEDYKHVFMTPRGQKVLWDLMKEHFIISPTFHENAMEMAYREGQRNTILRILALLKIDTKKLLDKVEEEQRIEENL